MPALGGRGGREETGRGEGPDSHGDVPARIPPTSDPVVSLSTPAKPEYICFKPQTRAGLDTRTSGLTPDLTISGLGASSTRLVPLNLVFSPYPKLHPVLFSESLA